MKKVLLSIFALAAYVNVNAQCNDLFISEYVEGSGNNKAIEIYNPSNSPIALNNLYRLIRYSNGQSEVAGNLTPNAPINLGTHVIGAHTAWVIVLDQRNPAGTGQTVPVVAALQAVADTFLCPDYSISYAMYFNGNDALALQKTPDGGTTWNEVDIFAQIGDAGMAGLDGTGGWNSIFPYDNAMYESAWTYNHTLIRHKDVLGGVTVNPNPFDVSQQWDSLPVNSFDSLRTHTCNCPTNLGVKEIDNNVSVQVFPNPVSNGFFTVSSTEAIIRTDVYNVVGEKVLAKEGNKMSTKIVIETGSLSKGIYFVKTLFDKNKSTTVKLIIQ